MNMKTDCIQAVAIKRSHNQNVSAGGVCFALKWEAKENK